MSEEPIVNFISGHLDLTPGEFDTHYRTKIDNAIELNQSFVVGDARGADTLAQEYLFTRTKAVVVYHMFATPRHNIGFPTRGGFQTDNQRDEQMTRDSHQDIAWVRPGREKSGTQANLNRRMKL